MSRLDDLRAWLDSTTGIPHAAHLLGIQIERVGDGSATVSMEASPAFQNSNLAVAGGLLAQLADVAMGCAVASLCSDDERWATLEMKISFLRAVPSDGGRVEADTRALHRTKRVAFAEAELRHGVEVVARVSSTLSIKAPR